MAGQTGKPVSSPPPHLRPTYALRGLAQPLSFCYERPGLKMVDPR